MIPLTFLNSVLGRVLSTINLNLYYFKLFYIHSGFCITSPTHSYSSILPLPIKNLNRPFYGQFSPTQLSSPDVTDTTYDLQTTSSHPTISFKCDSGIVLYLNLWSPSDSSLLQLHAQTSSHWLLDLNGFSFSRKSHKPRVTPSNSHNSRLSFS